MRGDSCVSYPLRRMTTLIYSKICSADIICHGALLGDYLAILHRTGLYDFVDDGLFFLTLSTHYE